MSPPDRSQAHAETKAKGRMDMSADPASFIKPSQPLRMANCLANERLVFLPQSATVRGARSHALHRQLDELRKASISWRKLMICV